ncbi:hypothetical protein SMACR_06675 [Sordaria macrospora]|uniref:Uncharacterized protein n=1 Tax=Sordaria macrospora TaxID=5147 RepID=A0A8S8ZP93_SORMA|nr:hypothetical protein SMACR_06675 [Sordaria macrospora]
MKFVLVSGGVVSGVGKGIIGRQSFSSQHTDDEQQQQQPLQPSSISLIRMESLTMDALPIQKS